MNLPSVQYWHPDLASNMQLKLNPISAVWFCHGPDIDSPGVVAIPHFQCRQIEVSNDDMRTLRFLAIWLLHQPVKVDRADIVSRYFGE